MKKHLPNHVGIKASRGIKTLKKAIALPHVRAYRVGTSSGVSIVTTPRTKIK